MSMPSLAVAESRPRSFSGLQVSAPVVLVLLALVTRLPLQSRMLYHWDSVNFALALQKFDVGAGEPQAPGYLLYVLLGRAAAALTGSAERGYVLLSIIGTALASWALYDLGRRLWNPRVGWFAALLLLSSPLFWFYGEIALPHTLDALMVIVAADLAWRVWQGEARVAPVLALWLGLAGGLREQTLVFMLPLTVAACLRLPPKTLALSVGVLAVTVAAWLVPLLSMTGGWDRYWMIVNLYSKLFDTPTSVFLGAGWHGLHQNLDKLSHYTAWAWAFGLIPPALALGTLQRTQAASWAHNPRVGLLALWAAPSLLFYVFVHMGQQGLIFVYLPVCLLVSARAGDALARRWSGGLYVFAACIGANALLYLLAPANLPAPLNTKVMSEATIRVRDRYVSGEVAAVTSGMPAGGVLVSDDWRYPQYYLPHVPEVAHSGLIVDGDSDTTGDGAPTVPAFQHAAVLGWYDASLDADNTAQGRTVLLPARDGVSLRLLRRPPGQHFWITRYAFGLAPDAPSGSQK